MAPRRALTRAGRDPRSQGDPTVVATWHDRDLRGGGGGIPMIEHADGTRSGVKAVIDKDATSALLAKVLGADALLLLTDVDGVYKDFDTDAPERIVQLSPQEAATLDLPDGSMGPKVAAGAQFAESGQR